MRFTYQYTPCYGESWEVSFDTVENMDAMEAVLKAARMFMREYLERYSGQSERDLMFWAGAAWGSREEFFDLSGGSLLFVAELLEEEKT